MTSQIIVENLLAGCFEFFKCQQMASMAQLYSWQITKVCLQTIKIFNKANPMILHDNSRSYLSNNHHTNGSLLSCITRNACYIGIAKL